MRFGILQRYPNLRRLSERASAYSALCRPFTLLGAFLSGFCMDIAFSRMQTGSFNIFHAIPLGLTLAFLQAGGQVMNQSIAEEVEIDRLNGKIYRPTVDGRITLKQAQITSILLYLAGILLALSLSPAYSLFSMLITFFAVEYTLPPIRMKRYLILNNVWQGVARGLLPVVYVALAYPQYLGIAIPYGAVLALWVTGAQPSKDFGDQVGDHAYGIQTLPVALGSEMAMTVMALTMFCAFVLLDIFLATGVLPWAFAWINLLVIPSGLILYGLVRGLGFKYAENNLSWVFFYGTLGLFYMLPSLLI